MLSINFSGFFFSSHRTAEGIFRHRKTSSKIISWRRSFSALSRKVSGNCLECFEDVETAFMPFNSFCYFFFAWCHAQWKFTSRDDAEWTVHEIAGCARHLQRSFTSPSSFSSSRSDEESVQLETGAARALEWRRELHEQNKKSLKIHSFEERSPSPQTQWDSRLPHRVKQMKMPEVAKRFFEAWMQRKLRI